MKNSSHLLKPDKCHVTQQQKWLSFEMPRDIAGVPVHEGIVKGTRQHVSEMHDSTEDFLLEKWKVLWKRFSNDRYLLIRQIIDSNDIIEARKKIDESLRDSFLISHDYLIKSGITVDVKHGNIIMGNNQYIEEAKGNTADILKCKEFLLKEPFESPELKKIYFHRNILKLLVSLGNEMSNDIELDVIPRLLHPQASWLRVKATNEYSPLHSDIFYFKQFTSMFPEVDNDNEFTTKRKRRRKNSSKYSYDDLSTDTVDTRNSSKSGILQCRECAGIMDDPQQILLYHDEPFCDYCLERPIIANFWIPLHDITVDGSVLAILSDSHLLHDYYVTETPDAHIPKSYATHSDELEWKLANVREGDIIFFDTHLIHCSTTNHSQQHRMSLDFRCFLTPLRDNWGSTEQSSWIDENSIPIDEYLTQMLH